MFSAKVTELIAAKLADMLAEMRVKLRLPLMSLFKVAYNPKKMQLTNILSNCIIIGI